ncbi:MAG: hypothetical protein HOY71_51195, partial [Nonomuraea sp.]|nr:hypothetical protein [Nonomuraea sp.]
MTTEDLVHAYAASRTTRDLLADDLRFRDPLDDSDTGEAFVSSMERLFSGPVRGILEQEILVDGDRAAIFSVWDTVAGPARFAEHLTIRD